MKVVCFFCAHTSQNKRLKVVMIDLDCLCLQEYLLHNHSKSRSLWLAFCEEITAIRNIGITHLWRVEPIDSVDCSGCAFRCEVSALLLRNSNPGIPTYFTQITRVRLSVFFCVYTSQNKRPKVVMSDLDCLCLQEYLTHNHSK